MTADEFAAWMQRRGLNDARAAPLLAADPSEVTRWRNGKRPVSRRVVRIVEQRDENDELAEALLALYKTATGKGELCAEQVIANARATLKKTGRL